MPQAAGLFAAAVIVGVTGVSVCNESFDPMIQVKRVLVNAELGRVIPESGRHL